MAVTGLVDPRRLLTNSGARPDDAIVLTKPLGTGILATAMKRGLADDAATRRAIDVMKALNKDAAEAISGVTVHACTDVTGFGLLGHLWETTRASRVEAEIRFGAVPWIDGAWELAAANVVPGGSLENLDHVENAVAWDDGIPRVGRILLCDAQTSGGLLICVAGDEADGLVDDLHRRGVADATRVGEVTRAGTGRISVRS
jgi:selenide,water dikinase